MLLIVLIIILLLLLWEPPVEQFNLGQYNDDYSEFNKDPDDISYNRNLMDFYLKYGYFPFYSLIPYSFPQYDKYLALWSSQKKMDLYLPDEY
jgi:hypothetical protein